jgi:hypothetical protein
MPSPRRAFVALLVLAGASLPLVAQQGSCAKPASSPAKPAATTDDKKWDMTAPFGPTKTLALTTRCLAPQNDNYG